MDAFRLIYSLLLALTPQIMTMKPKIPLDLFLKQKAFDFLSRREHSEQELKQKLTRYLENENDFSILEEVLLFLQTKGYVSNARFCESYLRTKSTRYGTYYLKQNLRLKGVHDTEIESKLEPYLETERWRAQQIWERRFHAQDPEDVKQYTKQVRFLQGRGFSLDIIRQIVKLKKPI